MKTFRLIMTIVLIVGLIAAFSAIGAEQTTNGIKGEPVTDKKESQDQKKAPSQGSKPIEDHRVLVSPRILEFIFAPGFSSEHFNCTDNYPSHIRVHSGSPSLGLRYVKINFDGDEIFRVNNPPGVLYNRWLTIYLSSLCPGASSGTYTLEAIAENTNGQIARRSIDLSIDNVPPTLTVHRPRNGEIFLTDDPMTDVTFEATASDDHSGVISFTARPVVGGRIVEEETVYDETPPYRITFSLPIGEHCFLIRVADHARNLTTTRINFSVSRPLPMMEDPVRPGASTDPPDMMRQPDDDTVPVPPTPPTE